MIPQSAGTEDNFGDYNTYSIEIQITKKGFPIILKGNDTLYNLAVSNDEQYSYSFYTTKRIIQSFPCFRVDFYTLSPMLP